MKTSLYFLVTALLMLAIVSCNNDTTTTPDSDISKSTITCLQDLPDRPVQDSTATLWMENWGSKWFDEKCTPLDRGFWPPLFKTDMASFKTLIDDHDQFRIYYSFCNELSGGSRAHLLATSLSNDSCLPNLGANIYNFISDNNEVPFIYEDCSIASENTIPKQTALDWTENFRSHFNISSTNDSVNLSCSDLVFRIPLAYTFDRESFEQYINQNADSLYVFLGIETLGPFGVDSYEYQFKLLFSTVPVSGQNELDFVDFAAPCPQICPQKDSLIGIY
ncbi:MAG: hypothetical protein AB8H47_04570 [Bacteroidia bacterium]